MKRFRSLAPACIAAAFVVICPPHAPGQDSPPRAIFLPGRPLTLPLVASDEEPRAGLSKEAGTSRLVLTIGSAIDLLEVRCTPDTLTMLRAGADFFTYALSSSIAGHRLQIDAVDGFFGGHLLTSFPIGAAKAFLRLRILHRSAHFVDGHFDSGTNSWRGGREPIPFTKDYGELLGAVAWDLSPVRFMAYSALSYATLVRPVEIRRVSSFHGLEMNTGDALGHFLGRPFSLFAACQLSLQGIPAYVGTGTLAGGIRLGAWDAAGIEILARYRSGLDMFGQYYNVRRSGWETGVCFDLW